MSSNCGVFLGGLILEGEFLLGNDEGGYFIEGLLEMRDGVEASADFVRRQEVGFLRDELLQDGDFQRDCFQVWLVGRVGLLADVGEL